MKTITRDELDDLQLDVQPSDIPIEDCFAYDDPEDTAAAVRAIREDLKAGNEWAWCDVLVTATWGPFQGTASLGACSYESEEQFRDDAYFADLVAEAVEDLNRAVVRASAKIDTLRA